MLYCIFHICDFVIFCELHPRVGSNLSFLQICIHIDYIGVSSCLNEQLERASLSTSFVKMFCHNFDKSVSFQYFDAFFDYVLPYF